MKSGLSTLHDIDKAIAQARKAVGEASVLPNQASEELASVRRRLTAAYDEIAAERLKLIGGGQGGDLGYVDRQAEKLLREHVDIREKLQTRLQAQIAEIEKFEGSRRTQEKVAHKAIDDYDKAAAAAEAKILKDPAYEAQLSAVELAESTVVRAEEKLEVAKTDEAEKGEPYRSDPFFMYLQNRQYGTKNAKGWFLTKLLDHWVARICCYREAAENYRRLRAIPTRIGNHVVMLEEKVEAEQKALQKLEADMLEREGVTAKHQKSLNEQAKLDEIDTRIAKEEGELQILREDDLKLSSGETGPYREAISLLSDTLQRTDIRGLKRIAAQTRSREDDRAIDEVRHLYKTAEDLKDDQSEAKSILKKYQRTLSDLEAVRQKFKSRRYDAPSSAFNERVVKTILSQMLRGALSGKDLWRQLERAQRTVRRYSDQDFGGIIWNEGLRLPRNSGGWGSTFPSGGGWGGTTRRRTSIPRMPRQSLPKVNLPSGGWGGSSRGGGFRTGGGF